ncbi:UNVERIFIED_CONTAM: hypothetical protein FKN15_069140 [Acipenser sinensis]
MGASRGCRPGGGRARSARVSSAYSSPATPVVWPGACGLACKLPGAALSSDAVALGTCMLPLPGLEPHNLRERNCCKRSWSPDLPPFFMASSSTLWGSGHSIFCCNAGLAATPGEAGPSATSGEAGPSAIPGEARPSATPGKAGPSATPDEAGPSATPGNPDVASLSGAGVASLGGDVQAMAAADPREVTAEADPQEATAGGERLAMKEAAGAPLLPLEVVEAEAPPLLAVKASGPPPPLAAKVAGPPPTLAVKAGVAPPPLATKVAGAPPCSCCTPLLL